MLNMNFKAIFRTGDLLVCLGVPGCWAKAPLRGLRVGLWQVFGDHGWTGTTVEQGDETVKIWGNYWKLWWTMGKYREKMESMGRLWEKCGEVKNHSEFYHRKLGLEQPTREFHHEDWAFEHEKHSRIQQNGMAQEWCCLGTRNLLVN